MVWCVEEPENFTFWHKNVMAKSDDYEKRNEFIKVMIEELDKAYGDRALMAGIRFGVDEFCKLHSTVKRCTRSGQSVRLFHFERRTLWRCLLTAKLIP